MNEPLEDTLLDNANYALFAYAMFLEKLAEDEANLPVNADGTFECCGGELGSHIRGCTKPLATTRVREAVAYEPPKSVT